MAIDVDVRVVHKKGAIEKFFGKPSSVAEVEPRFLYQRTVEKLKMHVSCIFEELTANMHSSRQTMGQCYEEEHSSA